MKKLRPVEHFNYSRDRLVIADMDSRDRSYIVKLVNYINELSNAHNELVDSIRTGNRDVEEAILKKEVAEAKEEKKRSKKKKVVEEEEEEDE